MWKSISVFALQALLAVLFVGVLGFGIHETLKNNVLGFEFYNFWTGGRAFLLEDRNPYSDEVKLQIQVGLYGRPALPTEDPMPFNYPPHVIFAMLPVLPMSYDWAQSYWMAMNLVGVLALFSLAFPKTPKWLLVSIPFLYSYAYGIILGSFSVLISAILALFVGYFVIARGSARSYQVGVGILLAWCTIKPQNVWLYFIFLVLFSLRYRLKALLFSFVISCMLFFALPLLLQPDWPLQWLGRLIYYMGYTSQNRPAIAVLDLFLLPFIDHYDTRLAYLVLNGASLGMTAFCFYRWWCAQLSDFTMLIAIALATYLLMPNNSSADQLSLLLPMVAWCAWQSEARLEGRLWWITLFVFSYLAFIASETDIYRRGLMVSSFVIVLAWISFLGIRAARRGRALGSGMITGNRVV